MKKIIIFCFLSLSLLTVSNAYSFKSHSVQLDGINQILDGIYAQLGIQLSVTDFICMSAGQYTFQSGNITGSMTIESVMSMSLVTVVSSAGNCSFIVEDNIDLF